MSIVHAKVSGNANTSPDDVGGEDWDHHHLHGVGAMFVHGFVQTSGSPDPVGVDCVGAYCFGAITGLTYDVDNHILTVAINPDFLPIVPGGVPDYYINWRKESPTWCSSALRPWGVTKNGSNQVIALRYLIDPQFSQYVDLAGTLYVLVG